MASLSLSEGSNPEQMEYGKRLSELLREQQEPFLLEEYLKQNGYSRKAPKCHPRSALFCSLSACKELLKRRSRGSTGGTTGTRNVLNKRMFQRVVAKLMNWGCGKQMEFRRLDNSFEGDSINGEENDWRKMEVCSRQLSPVSVFELHSDEDSSPTHEYTNFNDDKLSTSSRDSEGEPDCLRALEFKKKEGEPELTSSTISSFNIDFTNMQLNVHGKDIQEIIWEPQEGLRSQISSRQTDEQVLTWEKITSDITKIPTFIELDFTKSEREWCQPKQYMTEIGSEIETLLFEEIRKETVLDLLGYQRTL